MSLFFKEDGGYIHDKKEGELRICGPIKIIAIVSDSARERGFGRVVEWINLYGKVYRTVLLMGETDEQTSQRFKTELKETGFYLLHRKWVWNHIIDFINESIPKKHVIGTNSTGWLEDQFVTTEWSAGYSNGSEAIYVGQNVASLLKQKGSLDDWQRGIGAACTGNPILALGVCSALAAPLIGYSGLESFAVHIVGESKTGKTTAMNVATSVYSSESYAETWSSTANGLEAVASNRNDMLLCLDEFKQAPAQDMDRVIYHIANGASKLRSNKDGSLAARNRWNTILLSTGELSLEEMFKEFGKEVSAGQKVRFIEVSIFGQFGAFDNLGDFKSAKEFAEYLNEQSRKNYGTLFKAWVDYLVSIDGLSMIIREEIKAARKKWVYLAQTDESQVNNVLDKLALLAAAGEIAANAGLIPWPSGHAQQVIGQVAEIWLDDRDSYENTENAKLVKNIYRVIQEIGTELSVNSSANGLSFDIENGELVWFIPQQKFRQLVIESYARQLRQVINLMLKRHWALSNEGARGTFKIRNDRFIKMYPQRFCRDTGQNYNFTRFFPKSNSLKIKENPSIPLSQVKNQ
ncbi:DUF927 domain-containing protein [Marinomonas gallaica]|uniref:DUF927 domain-containing protein n=1 Tax=Marinomonas gallaica TaxID=1806667 RepID=UPI003A8C9B52